MLEILYYKVELLYSFKGGWEEEKMQIRVAVTCVMTCGFAKASFPQTVFFFDKVGLSQKNMHV